MESKVVFPGDVVAAVDVKARLGPGLLQHGDTIVSTKCGVLRRPLPNYLFVEHSQKRYVPAVEDMVIGTVLERHAESYKIDLGAAHAAVLPALAFEGATKKNRPNLAVGTLVYARMALANKDMEPELVCYSARNKADGYGELHGGHVVHCSTGLAHTLLDENCVVLQALGRLVPFEIAVGMNGRVWINSASRRHTILISNCILNSEFLQRNQTKAMVAKLAPHFQDKQ